MSSFYKVHKLNVNNEVETIYVFCGTECDETKITEDLFPIDKPNKPKVVFCDQQIHPDDSILNIKIKILTQLSKSSSGSNSTPVSLEEMYLFCQKQEQYDSQQLYGMLIKQQGRTKQKELTSTRVDQFIKNTSNPELLEIEKKEVYDYNDIFKLNVDKVSVNVPIASQSMFDANNPLYIYNPFVANANDYAYMKELEIRMNHTNNTLLLESGPIIHNTIYLCLAEDVLSYIEDINKSFQVVALKIYFHSLYLENIHSQEQLEEKRSALIKKNVTLYNTNTLDSFKVIDIFYTIYDKHKASLTNVKKGIRYINAMMKPPLYIKIPIETIFKIIHSTQQIPLIKYNPSKTKENIYRIYTNAVSTNGQKIPYLKKTHLFQLIKKIGMNYKSVSFYMETPNKDIIICEMIENGVIGLEATFHDLFSLSQINELLKEYVNPLLTEIKNVLNQSGYSLQLFKGLEEPNIEITHLTFNMTIDKIKKAFQLDKYKACIYSIFINETSKSDKQQKMIKLRYKRVSNFNKFNSIDTFIIDKYKEGQPMLELVQNVIQYFPDEKFNEPSARALIAQTIERLKQKERNTKVKINNGFKTEIQEDTQNSMLKIVVENINSIYYLDTISMYIESMVWMTQHKINTCYLTEKQQQTIEDNMLQYTNRNDKQQVLKKLQSDSTSMSDKSFDGLVFDNEYSDSDNATGGGSSDNSNTNDTNDNDTDDDSANDDSDDDSETDQFKNIDNMNLKRPSYFQRKIYEKDKVLIIKKDTNEYNSYSRTCSASA